VWVAKTRRGVDIFRRQAGANKKYALTAIGLKVRYDATVRVAGHCQAQAALERG
jgi:hypothetical protein